MCGYGGYSRVCVRRGSIRTCFRDSDGKVRERDETHWRSYNEGRLDPWVVGLKSLNWVHCPLTDVYGLSP
jgi:hypothetical protein